MLNLIGKWGDCRLHEREGLFVMFFKLLWSGGVHCPAVDEAYCGGTIATNARTQGLPAQMISARL